MWITSVLRKNSEGFSLLLVQFKRLIAFGMENLLGNKVCWLLQSASFRESIFGYRDLKVRLYYAECSLAIYLNMSYAEKIDVKKSDGVKADNVLKMIKEKLPPKIYTNCDEFLALLQKESLFRPFGTHLQSFVFGKGNQNLLTYLFWFIFLLGDSREMLISLGSLVDPTTLLSYEARSMVCLLTAV